MASEKVFSAGEATDDAIQAFVRDGEASWVDGSRHSSEQTALGSGPDAERARLEYLEQRGTPLLPTPPVQERLMSDEPAPADYQQLYGNEANEKGKWRRTAEEALAELNQAKAELAALRNFQAGQGAPTGYPPAYGYQPQYQPAYQPTYAPQYATAPNVPQIPQNSATTAPTPMNFFNKEAGEFIEVSEMNKVLGEVVAPAVMQLWQQQQMLQQAQVAAMKMTAGITPQVEQRLTMSFPWLQSIQDGPPRIAAMQDVLARESQQPTAPVRAPQATQSPVEAAARRVTYIESSGQRSMKGPGEGPTVAQIMKEEFDKAQTAAEKKAVLLKYGTQQVNDFGPGVLSR